MAPAGRGCLERFRRGARTIIFMVSMIFSLLSSTFPVVLVAAGDVAFPLAIISTLLTPGDVGIRFHLRNYSFRASLIDFPFVSALRSLIILSVYSKSDAAAMSHGPYLGAVSICSIVSVIVLFVKACIYTVTSPHFDAIPVSSVYHSLSPVSKQKLSLATCWALPILFLSSTGFALGHVIIAYRSSCRARRKLFFHRFDPEAVFLFKSTFSGYEKVCRSPTPVIGRTMKCGAQSKKKCPGMLREEDEIPVGLLADADSLFAACNGVSLHYKICLPDTSATILPTLSVVEVNRRKPSGPLILERQGSVSSTNTPKNHFHRSYSIQFNGSNLCTPLLDGSTNTTLLPDGLPALSFEYPSEEEVRRSSTGSLVDHDLEKSGGVGVVFVHGFGGGVFSWRHVMSFLADQACCRVVAFDRPGWGLTSRSRRKDWVEKELPNPYTLDSQVDLLLSFCSEMGFSSVIFVAHDDGGLIALKAAQKIQTQTSMCKVTIRGIVLLNVSLSREVVPAFARILLRTSLGKKHLVRPLLRTEIIQVVNRCAWYDNAKLTAETLKLYKAPLCIEGWEEAMHEIGKLSCETVLSPQASDDLINSVGQTPILVVSGCEDVLVPLKTSQAMASRFHNSRLVTISGCGHLPHEECPKALLAALTPFIIRLLQQTN